MGVCFVVYNVIEQILFYLLGLEVVEEILHKHIVSYFEVQDATDKI